MISKLAIKLCAKISQADLSAAQRLLLQRLKTPLEAKEGRNTTR